MTQSTFIYLRLLVKGVILHITTLWELIGQEAGGISIDSMLKYEATEINNSPTWESCLSCGSQWHFGHMTRRFAGNSWWVLHSWLIEDLFRQFPRLTNWNFYEKPDSFIWNKRSNIPFNSSFESVQNWCNFELEVVTTTGQYNRMYWFVHRLWAAQRDPYLCRAANMCCRTCVVVRQMQSNPIQGPTS